MKEKVANFILDFQARNRQVRDAREAEIIQTEQIRSVMRGASALVEANIPREQSVFLLQKYWDLRPSEAEKAIWQAENRAKKGWSNLNLTVARLYGETATAVVL